MRVLVCGGRDYNNRWLVYRTLRAVYDELPSGEDMIIVQGGASGADKLAEDWAFESEVICIRHPAQWKRYGKRAGPIRNAQMLQWRIDLVVAFPGRDGTEDMVARAKAKGIKVLEVGK